MQKLALTKAQEQDIKGFDLAAMMRAWIEMERLKREMRGIPALSAASLRELLTAKREAARTLDVSSSTEPLYREKE